MGRGSVSQSQSVCSFTVYCTTLTDILQSSSCQDPSKRGPQYEGYPPGYARNSNKLVMCNDVWVLHPPSHVGMNPPRLPPPPLPGTLPEWQVHPPGISRLHGKSKWQDHPPSPKAQGAPNIQPPSPPPRPINPQPQFLPPDWQRAGPSGQTHPPGDYPLPQREAALDEFNEWYNGLNIKWDPNPAQPNFNRRMIRRREPMNM